MSKIVVITGAGAGVGRATAQEFARQGFDVVLLSRDAARLESAAEEARSQGVRALAIPTDVADSAAVDAAAEQVEAELGPIDVWVNVAMATVFSPVSKLTAEEVARGTSRSERPESPNQATRRASRLSASAPHHARGIADSRRRGIL